MSMERKEKSQLPAKALFLSGGVVFVAGAVLSGLANSPFGIPLCLLGIILMAAGFILKNRPEYVVFLPWQ